MERVKLEQRRIFTKSEKQQMLSKSGGKCCHCGKMINIGSDFTVEHVIPISKGGSNEIANLVALCKDCNQDKDNYIVSPVDYYKYLHKGYLKELQANQYLYNETISWFSLSNFLKVDKTEIDVDVNVGVPRMIKGKYRVMQATVHYVLSRVVYSDLDDVYSFIKKYNSVYGIEEDPKSSIAFWFEKGAVYTIKNASKEIVSVFTIRLCNFEEVDYVGILLGIFILSKKENNVLATKRAWYRIMEDIHSLYGEDGVTVFALYSAKADTLSCSIVEDYYGGVSHLVSTFEDSITKMFLGCFIPYESKLNGTSVEVLDVAKEVSRELLKRLNLTYEDCIRIFDFEKYCKDRRFVC